MALPHRLRQIIARVLISRRTTKKERLTVNADAGTSSVQGGQRTYSRYVALGDSQTEGLNDGDPLSGYRGWADRLAENLALTNPGLRYANLAVRGCLAWQVRAGQLDTALSMRPDLATVVAGMNDLLRPRFDSGSVTNELEHMFAALTESGATVATITFPDIGRVIPIARPLRNRVIDLNDRIRRAAARHGVIVLDAFSYEVSTDKRIWSHDRIHATPLGHTVFAAAMAHVLNLPGTDDTWTRVPPPATSSNSAWRLARSEAEWVARTLLPWLARRVRGRSSGDGRGAKRPELVPLDL